MAWRECLKCERMFRTRSELWLWQDGSDSANIRYFAYIHCSAKMVKLANRVVMALSVLIAPRAQREVMTNGTR